MDLCHDTSIQFGERPPLFAKPPGYVEPPRRTGPGGARPQPTLDAQDADLAELFLANPMMRCASMAYIRGLQRVAPACQPRRHCARPWARCNWARKERLCGVLAVTEPVCAHNLSWWAVLGEYWQCSARLHHLQAEHAEQE